MANSGTLFCDSMRIAEGATLILDDERCVLSTQNLILESGATLVFRAGTIEIDGGTLMVAEGNLGIGETASMSTLRLINGASAFIEGNVFIAEMLGTRGLIEVDGSTLVAETLHVGVGGDAKLHLFNDATVDAAQTNIGMFGTVEGNGTLDGPVQNNGLIMPYNSDRIEIIGDLIQGAGGTIAIQLGDLEREGIIVHGHAMLNGHLRVRLLERYIPPAGSRFVLIAATGSGTVSQQFATLELPECGMGLSFTIGNESSKVSATIEQLSLE
jgi:hypothetical protein